jgi:bacterioferritin-associated ferredoxin
MIICLCEGLSETAIRRAVDQGSRTVQQLAASCGAGRNCGSCGCDLKRIISEAIAPEAAELEAEEVALSA